MTPHMIEIASGLGFPEGPVMLPDGAMLVVEIRVRDKTMASFNISGVSQDMVGRPGLGAVGGGACGVDAGPGYTSHIEVELHLQGGGGGV